MTKREEINGSEEAALQRTRKTAITFRLEESSMSKQRSSRPRSPSSSPSPSSPLPSSSTQDQDVFNVKYLQLLQLCDRALLFLACLIKQDTSPLTAASSDVDPSWDRDRQHLDEVFRSLASWGKDLETHKPLLAHDSDNALILVVDSVITSFLAVTHRLMHLVDSTSEDTSITDKVLLKVTQTLAQGVDQLQKERETIDYYCPVCGQTDELIKTSDCLDELSQLVDELKDDSKPLQLAMRRRNWLEQIAGSTSRLPGDFNHSEERVHKGRYGKEQTSRNRSPRRSKSPVALESGPAKIFAKPRTQRTRSMKTKGDLNEAVGHDKINNK